MASGTIQLFISHLWQYCSICKVSRRFRKRKSTHITVLKPDVFSLSIRLLVYIAHVMVLKPDVSALRTRLLVYIGIIKLFVPKSFK